MSKVGLTGVVVALGISVACIVYVLAEDRLPANSNPLSPESPRSEALSDSDLTVGNDRPLDATLDAAAGGHPVERARPILVGRSEASVDSTAPPAPASGRIHKERSDSGIPEGYTGTKLEWRLRSELPISELREIASRPRLRHRERRALLTNLAYRRDRAAIELLLEYRSRVPEDTRNTYAYARALRRVVERSRGGGTREEQVTECAVTMLDVLSSHLKAHELPVPDGLWSPVRRALEATRRLGRDAQVAERMALPKSELSLALLEDWRRLEHGRPWLGGLDSLRLGSLLTTPELANVALALLQDPQEVRRSTGNAPGDDLDQVCFQELAKTIYASGDTTSLGSFVALLEDPPDDGGLTSRQRMAWTRELANALHVNARIRTRAKSVLAELEETSK